MVVDRLYYNSDKPVQASFDFSPEVLRKALLKIYSEDFRPMTDIEENMFNEVFNSLKWGIDKGISMSDYPDPDKDFIDALYHSAGVFSAFKVHRAQNDMARLLVDSNGNLKSFQQWSKDVMPIASHQCEQWLRTEYDTAVLRAHQAADWQQFMREKDVLPNLKWMPSTSVTPGEDHRIFWGVIRPIEDKFWNEHRPGDRWNCKCSLTSTAEKPTQAINLPESPKDKPQKGLSTNPGLRGEIFSDNHPYYPDSCGSCPFYNKSFKNRISDIFFNRVKDCYHCPYIDNCIDRAVAKKPIDDAAFSIKQRAKDNNLMPKFDKSPCKAIKAGMLNRTNKVRNTLLKHCHHDYEVEAAIYIWNNPDQLKFIRVSPLGEGKDLSSDKNIANIKKKMFVLGFIEFRVYQFDHDGKTYILKTALCKKGYEQFYSIMEK